MPSQVSRVALATHNFGLYRGYAAKNPAAAFQQALAINDNNRLKNHLLDPVIKVQIESGGLQAAKLGRFSDRPRNAEITPPRVSR